MFRNRDLKGGSLAHRKIGAHTDIDIYKGHGGMGDTAGMVRDIIAQNEGRHSALHVDGRVTRSFDHRRSLSRPTHARVLSLLRGCGARQRRMQRRMQRRGASIFLHPLLSHLHTVVPPPSRKISFRIMGSWSKRSGPRIIWMSCTSTSSSSSSTTVCSRE